MTVVHYAPYGPNPGGKWDCGAPQSESFAHTRSPDKVTCLGCKRACPGLWPELVDGTPCPHGHGKSWCAQCLIEENARTIVNPNAPQPPPIANDSTPVWELVIADMQERDKEGRRKYGVPLQANNGRDALIDAYQEALDLVVYLKQAIIEREQGGK